MGEKGLVNRYDMKKYQGQFELYESEFRRDFKPGEFWFVQDMSDLFAETVPDEMIEAVLNHISKFPKTRFLLLTKNPKRYHDFLRIIPSNCVLGVTIETDGEEVLYHEISHAPHPIDRISAMIDLSMDWTVKTMISIEPILQFNFKTFLADIAAISPEFVAVGYDNYGNRLPEPSLKETLSLIDALEGMGIKVYRKTLREAWWGA